MYFQIVLQHETVRGLQLHNEINEEPPVLVNKLPGCEFIKAKVYLCHSSPLSHTLILSSRHFLSACIHLQSPLIFFLL